MKDHIFSTYTALVGYLLRGNSSNTTSSSLATGVCLTLNPNAGKRLFGEVSEIPSNSPLYYAPRFNYEARY